MAINTGNVMVGVAQLYVAPFGQATPGEPEPMVANSVLLGTAWGGNWVAMGATEQGVKVTVAPKTTDILVEEQMTPALVTVDSMDISVATTFSEDTLANMKIAYGGGAITTVAPGVGVPGTSELALADSLELLSVGFEGVNPFGFYRRYYLPKVVSVASVDTSYRRAAAARLYPVNLRAICDPATIAVIDMTAVAT